MAQAHIFRSSLEAWQAHPTFDGIHVKSLENSSTFPNASVTLVQIDRGGEIKPHQHEQGWESAYVLSGKATLTLPDGDVTLGPGDGVTIPRATIHSLCNSGPGPVQILAFHLPPIL